MLMGADYRCLAEHNDNGDCWGLMGLRGLGILGVLTLARVDKTVDTNMPLTMNSFSVTI